MLYFRDNVLPFLPVRLSSTYMRNVTYLVKYSNSCNLVDTIDMVVKIKKNFRGNFFKEERSFTLSFRTT